MTEIFFPDLITNWRVPEGQNIKVGDNFEGATVTARRRDGEEIERMDFCKSRNAENCKMCPNLSACGAPVPFLCNDCDNGKDGGPCKNVNVGPDDQLIYTARGWCGWKLVGNKRPTGLQ